MGKYICKMRSMYSRLLKKPLELETSFFLFGPRGTGKTTWLKRCFSAKDDVYVDLLDSDMYTELLGRPKRLETLIPPDFSGWIVLDEIQRIPALLNEVHRLIEDRGLRFVLTGSSARSLRKKGVNLLAGRALTFHMHPLTAAELGDDFELKRSVQYGQLPAVTDHRAPDEYLKSYISTYLREEIQQEGFVRNLGNFTRFLETASFSQGSPLNVSEVAREAGLNRNTVISYFDILEDLLIGYRLPVFTKRARRRMVAHPKFYFFDTGVYRFIRPQGPLDAPEEIEGPCFETLLLQELRALNDYLGLQYDICYWRTSNGMEVDFVLYGPRGILAFEVKRSTRYTQDDFAGLKSFKKDYPDATCYLLYGGYRSRWEKDIAVLPASETLTNLASVL